MPVIAVWLAADGSSWRWWQRAGARSVSVISVSVRLFGGSSRSDRGACSRGWAITVPVIAVWLAAHRSSR